MTTLLTLGQALTTNARLFPERIGARDLDRAMTFRQWNHRACRLANALLGLGLAKGDRVAVLAYNCVEWMEIYAATAKAGLVMVPVNFRLVGAEVAYIAGDSGASAMIVQDQLAGVLPQLVDRHDVRVVEQPGDLRLAYEAQLERLVLRPRHLSPESR